MQYFFVSFESNYRSIQISQRTIKVSLTFPENPSTCASKNTVEYMSSRFKLERNIISFYFVFTNPLRDSSL